MEIITKELIPDEAIARTIIDIPCIDIKFRAALEELCEILIFTIRCKLGKFYYDTGIVSSLKSLELHKPSSPLVFIAMRMPIERIDLVGAYKNTVYGQVVETCVRTLTSCSSVLDNKKVNIIKFRLDYDSCLVASEDTQIPARYRIGVTLVTEDNSCYYSEYWENLGWIINSTDSLGPNVSKLITELFQSKFFAPVVDMGAIMFDSNNNTFISGDIVYRQKGTSPELKVLDNSNGSVFGILANEFEPNSVLVPYRSINMSSAIEGVIKEKIDIIHDSNGLDSFPLLRSVRASESLIAIILTYLYSDEYYADIVKMLIPRQMQLQTWKFSSPLPPEETYIHMYGANIVTEFHSIMNIPSDRLSKLGVSVPQIIEEARDAYSWMCSINWRMRWNQTMESSKNIVSSLTIPFNFSKYRVSINLTKIETMFYFIASVQRYLLLVYMKLLSNLSRERNKSNISLFLGMNMMMLQGIKFFNKEQEITDKKFFKKRSISIKGNNVTITGLVGSTCILSTNEIYLKWLEISKARLRGDNLFYPEITVSVLNNSEKTYSNIMDFILSDIIRVYGLICSELIKNQFPQAIETIDFQTIYNLSKDTTSINHKRLCIELCKYYCAFYGDMLIVEDYTKEDI